MTFHKVRRGGRAKGSARKNGNGHKLNPRISVTYPEDDFRRVTWLAKKRGLPVADVLRTALWAYLVPVAADADAER